jgi:L-rhamnose mutarotase
MEAQYKERHRNPPPELVRTFQEHGIHNFSVWTADDLAIMYAEIQGEDLWTELSRVAETSVSKEWEADMITMKQAEVVPGTGEMYRELEEIWYVE